MNTFLKITSIVALAFSLAACQDDKGHRAEVKVEKAVPEVKPAVETIDAVELKPTAEVLYSESSQFAEGIIDPAAYHVFIEIPNADGKTTKKYTRSWLADNLNRAEQSGSDTTSSFSDGTINELTRIQVLDGQAKLIVFSVYSDENLIDGKAYVFAEKDAKMEVILELVLDKDLTDQSIVESIREFSKNNDVSLEESAQTLADNEKIEAAKEVL